MIPVFVGYPKPHLQVQQEFTASVCEFLRKEGFEPRTLGVSDYDMDAPLAGIRRLMFEVCGLLSIAFRRTLIHSATQNHGADMPKRSASLISDVWLTSAYSQIEPAMAFQLGLPTLIWKEEGVIGDGVLEKGVLGQYLPEFRLGEGQQLCEMTECLHILRQWGGRVRMVYENRGKPPNRY